MAEKTKYNPEAMRQAVSTFDKAQRGLEDVNKEVLSISNSIQESLKGNAGNEFVNTLQVLSQSLVRFAAKMNEIEGDIKTSMEQMAQTDKQNSQMF